MSGTDGTDADADQVDAVDSSLSALDRVLDSLKRPREHADDHRVSSDEHARMSWSSVTEAEPEPEPAPPIAPESSFKFDLGSALARLGGEQPSSIDAVPLDAGGRPPAASPVARGDAIIRLDDPPIEPPSGVQVPSVAPATANPAAVDLPTRRPTVEPSNGTPPPSALPKRAAASTVDEYPAALPQRAPTTDATAAAPAIQPDALPHRAPTIDATTHATSAIQPDALPHRAPTTDPATHATSAIEPAVAPAPPMPDPPARATSGANHRSVFEDAAPAPALPSSPQRMPSVEPSPPVIPAGALPNLPTLPPAAPVAAPVIAEPVGTGPTAPDIHAVRSYQLRAQRDQRRNKVVARTLLVVLLLAAAVAAALFFGRSYLYPTEWDASLTPIVDDIQEANGSEFTEEIPLETLDNAAYAALALDRTVGESWDDRFAEWRALGVATGAADSSAIVDAVVAWRPAIYDPETDTLYRATEVEPAALDAALRAALQELFARQHGSAPEDEFAGGAVGVVGVSPLEKINSRALDRVLLVGGGDAPSPAAAAPAGTPAAASAPLPLLYEFAATDRLGAPLVAAAGDAAANWSFGDTYPPETLTATQVPRVRAAPSPVPADAEADAEPVALGPDDWSLVWSSRLPGATVDRLVAIVAADAYRPVTSAGRQCFVADLRATSATTANEVLGAMARWIAAGPPSAAGGATLVAPNVVQVIACDPGADAQLALDATAVTALLDRQQSRL